MLVHVALYTVVLPALIAATALVAAWRLRANRSADYWGPAVGLGVGYIAGYLGILGWPMFPPLEVTQWLFLIAVTGLALGITERWWRRHLRITWAVRFLIMGAVSWILLRPLVTYSWSTALSVAWLAGLTAGAIGFWKIQQRLDGHAAPRFHALLLTVLGTTESVVIGLSSSVALAQLQGVLTAAVAATFLVAWRLPRALDSLNTGIPLVSLLFVTHGAAAFFFAEMPAASAVLLALAPLGALLAWKGRKNPRAMAAGLLAALVMEGAAIVVAVLRY